MAPRPAYESQARVLVHPITGDTSKPAEPVSALAMGTERELVSADGVVQLVQRRTGWKGSLADLRRPLDLSVLGGTQTMAIRYRADNAERARLGAQLFAESYLTYRGEAGGPRRHGAGHPGHPRRVADARHATREELAEVGEQLRLVGGNVLGAVLCNFGG